MNLASLEPQAHMSAREQARRIQQDARRQLGHGFCPEVSHTLSVASVDQSCPRVSRKPYRVVSSLLRQQNASPMDDLTSIKDRVSHAPSQHTIDQSNVQVMRVKCLLRNYRSVFQSESDVDTKVCRYARPSTAA